MTLEQEVDARVMEIFNGATIEDLERGLKNSERAVHDCGVDYTHPTRERNQNVTNWQHYAELLRAELKRKQAAQ